MSARIGLLVALVASASSPGQAIAGELVENGHANWVAQPAGSSEERYAELYDAAEQAKSAAIESGQWEPAELAARRFLDFARQEFGPRHEHTAGALYTMGLILKFSGRLVEAEPYWAESLDISLETAPLDDETNPIADQILEVVDLYFLINRSEAAERLLLRTLRLIQQANPENPLAGIDLLHQLAGLYNTTDRFAEAEPIMRRIIATYREHGLEPVDAYGILHDLGSFYLNNDRVDEAHQALQEVETYYVQHYGDGSEHVLWVRNDLAEVLRRQGRDAQAIALLRANIEASSSYPGQEAQDHQLRIRMDSLRMLAAMMAARGDLAEAERLRSQALAEWQRSIPIFMLDEAQLAYEVARAKLSIGAGGEAALPATRVVSRWLDTNVDFGPGASELYLAEGAPVQWAHSLLADVLWAARPAGSSDQATAIPEQVFSSLQRATSDPAGDVMIRTALRQQLQNTDPTSAELMRRMDALQERLRQNRMRYAQDLALTETTSEERTGTERERVRLEGELATAESALRNRSPSLFEQAVSRPVTIREAQAALGPDEAILLIVPSEFGTHSVAVTRDGAMWARSPLTDPQVSLMARSLLWDLGAGVVASEEELARLRERSERLPTGFDRNSAFDLYRALVQPHASALAGKRHLYIVAGRSLASLPFGVLVTRPPAGSDSDASELMGTSWLIDDHALTQLPSIRTLTMLRSQRASEGPHDPASAPFVGFGDPVLPDGEQRRGERRRGEAVRVSSVLRRDRFRSGAPVADPAQIRGRFRALPGTGPELERLRSALGASSESVFVRERATETNVKRTDLSGVGLLAFATHGLLAGEIEGSADPGLILTPPDVPSEEDDGFLSATEVAGLRLGADWVVLSACNTAVADGWDGSFGLSRLSRAFFSAGARSLLASLWPVPDDVAPAITVRMLELQREHPTDRRAEALRQTLGEVRRRTDDRDGPLPWAHPGVWAPFILIGGAEQ